LVHQDLSLFRHRRWGIGEHEDALLQQAAALEDAARQTDAALYLSSLTPLCSSIGSREALALAAAVDAVVQVAADRQKARYRQILASLSKPTALAITEALTKNIAPGVSYSSGDNAIVAEYNPDFFKQNVQSECDAYLKGPPSAFGSRKTFPETEPPRRTLSADEPSGALSHN
jgi:hypothetical protein